MTEKEKGAGCAISLAVVLLVFLCLPLVREFFNDSNDRSVVAPLYVGELGVEEVVGTYNIDERYRGEIGGSNTIELYSDGTCEFLYVYALRGGRYRDEHPFARLSGQWKIQRMHKFGKTLAVVVCYEGVANLEYASLLFDFDEAGIPEYHYFYTEAAPHGVIEQDGEVAGLAVILARGNNETHFSVPFWRVDDGGRNK